MAPHSRNNKWKRLFVPITLTAALTVSFAGTAAAQPSWPDMGSSGSSSFDSSGSGSVGSSDPAGSGDDAPIDIDSPSDWAPGAPIETKIIPKPETVIVEAGQVTSIDGEPGQDQTVVYSPDGRTPIVGDFLAVNTGFGVPGGTVGRITSVEQLGGGIVRVLITAATLDDAYEEFRLNTHVTFEDNTSYEPGQGGAPSNSRARPTGFPTLGGALNCSREDPAGAALSVDLKANLSDVTADVQFDLFSAYMRVELSTVTSIQVGVEGSMKVICELPYSWAPKATLPTGGPTSLTVSPVLGFEAEISGGFNAKFSKKIRSGFESRGSSIRALSSNDAPTFNVTPQADVTGSAKIYAGVQGKWGLQAFGFVPAEGTANVKATAFGKLETSTSNLGCLKASTGLRAEASLSAKAWKAVDWNAVLGGIDFGVSASGPFCPGADPGTGNPDPNPGNGGTNPPAVETRPGQLSGLSISPNLQCRVNSPTDGRSVFYGDNKCATDLAVDGTTYGYNFSNSQPQFQQVGQTQSGQGTRSNPTVVTTDVAAGTTGVTLRQTDTFVDSSSEYLSAIKVTNTSDSPRNIILYRAADCYLSNSDLGIGDVYGPTAFCIAANGRSIAWSDLTGGATAEEGSYSTIWNRISSAQPFNGTAIGTQHDNAAGLSWTATLQPGQELTFRSRFQLLEPATPVNNHSRTIIFPDPNKADEEVKN